MVLATRQSFMLKSANCRNRWSAAPVSGQHADLHILRWKIYSAGIIRCICLFFAHSVGDGCSTGYGMSLCRFGFQLDQSNLKLDQSNLTCKNGSSSIFTMVSERLIRGVVRGPEAMGLVDRGVCWPQDPRRPLGPTALWSLRRFRHATGADPIAESGP